MTVTFSQFPLAPEVLKALEEMQYKEPSEIQARTLPLILEGKDLIGLAKTGSGKTAACAIPMCNMVDPSKPEVQALIIVPTRELAMQYAHEAQKIGKHRGVKAFGICGGEDASMQLSKLKSGVQILTATPGRLIDFIYSRSIDLTHVKTLILDEADEMLSMGFVDDLEFIMQCLVHEHQTLLFSATMAPEIKAIATKYLKTPEEILLTSQASPALIDHHFLFCRNDERPQKLVELIKKAEPKQAIIFCHSRIQSEQVCHFLRKELHQVDLLHAGYPQDVRSIVTNKFRSGKVRYLVATDVVARGLDFSNVSHVFIYELSQDPDVYIHRSGRTGRFDKEGDVITLVTRRELHTAMKIEKKLGHPLNWLEGPPPPSSEARPPRPAARHHGPRRRSPPPPNQKF